MVQPVDLDRPTLLAQIAATKAEIDRRKYLADPVLWVKDKLGEDLWSKQREIMRSVRDNRRTSVLSCHDSGKSFVAARVAAWWLAVHPPGEAFVVTSAPTGRQVKAILWREISRAHAKGKLHGRLNQVEWWMTMPAGNEEIVAFGQKPADLDPAAFQGIHAPYVLVIFDEACGIPQLLWEAADSLIANEGSHFLVIGNPDDPASEFYNVSQPNTDWNVIHISAFATPNFTDEKVHERVAQSLVSRTWVAEKERKWGVDNPLYISKVLGKFPKTTVDGLIPLVWLRAAQNRDLPEGSPRNLGLDVGAGGDSSTIASRKGSRIRIIHEDHNPDTMSTTGHLLAAMRDHSASHANIDGIGIGKGTYDRCAEQNYPVSEINVGMASPEDGFHNLRAWGYWKLREGFQDNLIDLDPNDDDTVAQLADIRYKRASQGGRLIIESKDDMKKRGRPSPNRADAVMLAWLEVPEEEVCTSATWGR